MIGNNLSINCVYYKINFSQSKLTHKPIYSKWIPFRNTLSLWLLYYIGYPEIKCSNFGRWFLRGLCHDWWCCVKGHFKDRIEKKFWKEKNIHSSHCGARKWVEGVRKDLHQPASPDPAHYPTGRQTNAPPRPHPHEPAHPW